MQSENLNQTDAVSATIANTSVEPTTETKINAENSGQPTTTPPPEQDTKWPNSGQEWPGHFERLREAQHADRKAAYDDFNNNRMNEVAADLQEHLSKRNTFEQLTEDQRQAILALLEEYPSRAVAAVLAEPPPRGLNFKIGKSALNNFRNRHADIAAASRRKANFQAAADLLDKSDNPDLVFQKIIDRDLKMRLLTASADPEADHRALATLILALTRFQRRTQRQKDEPRPS